MKAEQSQKQDRAASQKNDHTYLGKINPDLEQTHTPVQRKLRDALVDSENSQRTTQLQSALQKNNETGIPDQLKSGIESLSGYSMDDVRVHYNSNKPAQLNAHAYAQGTAIHLASGQEKHLPHEAWHVVQQKQGRVPTTKQLRDKQVNINDDAALEKEADVMGEKAVRGAQGSFQDLKSATPAHAVTQRKLGLELELPVLIDIDGRPIPEKVPIAKIGQGATITVDQNASVASPTPTAAQDANVDMPDKGLNSPDKHLGAYDLPDGWTRKLVKIPIATRNRKSTIIERYDSEQQADVARQTLETDNEIRPLFIHSELGENFDHPMGDGMGTDEYASIIEIATDPFEVEKMEGEQGLIRTMQEVTAFARSIDPNTRALLRTATNVLGVRSPDHIYIGHNDQTNQSTSASIQSNLGIALHQIPALFESIADNDKQGIFKMKHHADSPNKLGAFAKHQLHESVVDSEEVITSVTDEQELDTAIGNKKSLFGLITLVIQYLRMCKYAYMQGSWGLDKNAVVALSKTDMTVLFNNLPLSQRKWVRENREQLISTIAKQAGRSLKSPLFTDVSEKQKSRKFGGGISVASFLDRVFSPLEEIPVWTADIGYTGSINTDEGRDRTGMKISYVEKKTKYKSDGITDKFGEISMLPRQKKLGKTKNSGPVLELRNMMPTTGEDRFSPDSWVNLTKYFIELLKILNLRSAGDRSVVSSDEMTGVTDSNLGYDLPDYEQEKETETFAKASVRSKNLLSDLSVSQIDNLDKKAKVGFSAKDLLTQMGSLSSTITKITHLDTSRFTEDNEEPQQELSTNDNPTTTPKKVYSQSEKLDIVDALIDRAKKANLESTTDQEKLSVILIELEYYQEQLSIEDSISIEAIENISKLAIQLIGNPLEPNEPETDTTSTTPQEIGDNRETTVPQSIAPRRIQQPTPSRTGGMVRAGDRVYIDYRIDERYRECVVLNVRQAAAAFKQLQPTNVGLLSTNPEALAWTGNKVYVGYPIGDGGYDLVWLEDPDDLMHV